MSRCLSNNGVEWSTASVNETFNNYREDDCWIDYAGMILTGIYAYCVIIIQVRLEFLALAEGSILVIINLGVLSVVRQRPQKKIISRKVGTYLPGSCERFNVGQLYHFTVLSS